MANTKIVNGWARWKIEFFEIIEFWTKSKMCNSKKVHTSIIILYILVMYRY